MMKKAYRKGGGSAYSLIRFPHLFEFARPFGIEISNPHAALAYKILSTLSKFFNPAYLLRPVALCYQIVGTLGFIKGYAKWIKEKPICGRADLPV